MKIVRIIKKRLRERTVKIGIYTPYLEYLAGGAKYICKIAQILSKENNVEFIVFKPPDMAEIQKNFNLDLNNVEINCVSLPNAVRDIPYLRGLPRIRALTKLSSKYDLFINQDNFLMITTLSKRGAIIFQAPPTKLNRPISLLNNPLINIFIDQQLKSYDTILAYSVFSKKWIEKYYNKDVNVLFPPIETEHFKPTVKQNIVLGVGRFFVGGNCKKQFEMVKAFKTICAKEPGLKKWQFHLVGGIIKNSSCQRYLNRCQEEAQGYPIYFHTNASFKDLQEVYGKAKIFWHAAGLYEDENTHPERMEHFGMTTVEAMSAGCVPVVINKGGQPEIVRHEQDGFLWNTVEELIGYTGKLATDENLWTKMSESSIKRSQNFNADTFESELKRILALK